MTESVGNLIRIAGFKANVDVNGKTVEVVDAKINPPATFRALVSSTTAIDPNSPLGTDLREADVVETLRDWLPASLLVSTTPGQIAAKVDGVRFKMTKREDNIANPFVRFDVVKVV